MRMFRSAAAARGGEVHAGVLVHADGRVVGRSADLVPDVVLCRVAAEVVQTHAPPFRSDDAVLSDLLHTLVKSTSGPDGKDGNDGADGSGGNAGNAGADDDATARRGLLRLRRQVFNNRLPADPEAAVRLVTRLDPAAGGRVARWLRDRARLDGLRARGAALLTGELQ